MDTKQLEAKQLYVGSFLTVLWDTRRRIIGIRWKASTARMTDEDFKAALSIFACQFEQMGAQGNPGGRSRFSSQDGAVRTGVARHKHLQPLCRRGRPALRVPVPAGRGSSSDDESVGGRRELCDASLHESATSCRMAHILKAEIAHWRGRICAIVHNRACAAERVITTYQPGDCSYLIRDTRLRYKLGFQFAEIPAAGFVAEDGD